MNTEPQPRRQRLLDEVVVGLIDGSAVALIEVAEAVSLLFTRRLRMNSTHTRLKLEWNFVLRQCEGRMQAMGFVDIDVASEPDNIWVVRNRDNGRVFRDPSYVPYHFVPLLGEDYLVLKDMVMSREAEAVFQRYLDIFMGLPNFSMGADGAIITIDGYASAGASFPGRWEFVTYELGRVHSWKPITMTILMLEDNSARIAAFEAAVRSLPDCELVVWRDAHRMIAEMAGHLASAVLISLDHDLVPEAGGGASDPGDGLEVCVALVRCKPTCPVILHTSNTARSWSMQRELRDAGWKAVRVPPVGMGEDWIAAVWLPEARELIAGEAKV